MGAKDELYAHGFHKRTGEYKEDEATVDNERTLRDRDHLGGPTQSDHPVHGAELPEGRNEQLSSGKPGDQ